MINYWQGNCIRLRAIELDDAVLFYQWNLDSERSRFLDFVWPPSSASSVRVWVEEQTLRKFDGDRFIWVIENLEGVAVGTIGTHACDLRSGSFRYGLDVAEEHRRKGYAAEAIWMVLRYYFEELRYQKVTVNVHSDNPASIGLHQRLGFQLEGTLRRMIFTEGVYKDELWFGLTAEEFRALNARQGK